MQALFKEYLFTKNILVFEGQEKSPDAASTLISLYALFNIRITQGAELAQPEMIHLADDQLGSHVPAPFYQGFPQSVRNLSKEEKLFDQLLHYTVTYGFGCFSQPGHSLLEEAVRRSIFAQLTEEKYVTIVPQEQAVQILKGYVKNLLAGTRPLSDSQYEMVKEYLLTYQPALSHCASKNTAVRLLLDTRDPAYARFLSMSDVIRLVEELNYREYDCTNIRMLNLRNQDRKFLTAVIDRLLSSQKCDIRTCYEKKALWAGLLHHIHYRPKTEAGRQFADCMRGPGNESVYAEFEKALAAQDIQTAVLALKQGKGSGAMLRNLNYIFSRCQTPEEREFVMQQLNGGTPLVLIQLLMHYHLSSQALDLRTFRFPKYGMLRVHRETREEGDRRHFHMPQSDAQMLSQLLTEKLQRLLKNRLGKVYIDPAMEKIALPIQESTTQGGYRVLPKGSRIAIPEGKIVRSFTYWEAVNDIDLSVIGMDSQGRQKEFSWRNFWRLDSNGLIFSGDQTSGYFGGSEYFDVDLDLFQVEYPDMDYLIFCDNVYSGTPFSKCRCTAGFMLRDQMDSGEVFEPKTVESSFQIRCSSTFAYLFAIDLKQREFVWLNIARDEDATVAGTTSLQFLLDYCRITDLFSAAAFFRMMAEQVVEDPMEADVILSDQHLPQIPEQAEVIHSCDVERMIALLN